MIQVIEKSIDELIPYEYNPRINDEAVEPVKNSIKAFGFKVPIIIDKENVIIAGHTRLLAAKELNLKKIPCVIADDLTEDEIKAFRLADNKVSEFSKWDFEKLEVEIDEIEIDMSDFGFDTESVNFDIDDMFSEEESEPKEQEEKEIQCPHCGMFFKP